MTLVERSSTGATDAFKRFESKRHLTVNANDRSIVGLVTVAHAMVHTYELAIPILMTIWLAEFGVTEFVLGAVVTVGFGFFGAGAIPAGILSDVVGSKRVIVGCLVGMGASFLVLAVSPTIHVVAVALLLWGAAASVYHPSGLSLISTGVSERGTAFAYHGMAGNFGIAMGPLAAAVMLFAVEDWRLVAAALALPSFVAAAYAVRVDVEEDAAVAADEPTRADGDGDAADGSGGSKADVVTSFPEFVTGARELFSGAFALVFVVVIMSGLYYRGVLTFLPTIFEDLALFEPIDVGDREFRPNEFLYSGVLMIGMLGQYVGGRLTDRIRLERGITGAFAVLAVLALLFYPAANAGTAPFLAASAVLGVALFVVQPMYQAAVAEYTPSGTRGLSYGFTYLGVFGVGALGGVIAGAILTYASGAVLFATLAAFASIAAAVGVLLGR